MSTAVVEQLRDHAVVGSAPDRELEWLAARGEVERHPAGVVVTRTGERVEALYVVLAGRLVIHIERAHGRRKITEWVAGDVTGVLPYSRMGPTPGDVKTVEPTELFVLPRDLVSELPAACPRVTEALVHEMVDRARLFTSADLHDQKALALGKVAAGLAHELNNPASALVRTAKTLTATLEARHAAEGDTLDADGWAAAATLYRTCRSRDPVEWDAIDRVDREEALEEWLQAAGESPTLASILADTPLELDELFGPDALPTRVAAAVAAHAARSLLATQLAAEIESGAARIYHLVDAVKRFTHMDRTMALDTVDLNAGIRDAAMLGTEKADQVGVTVSLDLDPDLPTVEGVVEELNQMWHALIDNAVDAASPDGTVTVTSAAGPDAVVVEVTDDGDGIPDAIQDRIFDPFFTTKPVGAGAGLGLELVRRVAAQHRADVEVDSRPGRTVFRVAIPA